MATVKEINHDSSTTLSDFYTDTIIDPDGRATVTIGSALGGSTNGVNLDYDAGGAQDTILIETFTALTGNDFRLRFRVNWSNVSSIPVTARFWIDLKDGSSNQVFRVEIDGDGGGGIEIKAEYWSDSGAGLAPVGAEQAISENSELCIELRAIKETADGNNDGEVELFVNGASIASISDADNFNRFGNQIAETLIRFNADTATGDLYYDEWILDNDSTVSLCATGSHIWLSTDGGATYTDIGASAWAANVVGGVVVVPGTAYQTIFAAVGTNLYKTVNGGTAWTLETAVGYEVDFIDLEKDNTTVFLAKRDAAGTNRASLWDSVGASLTHINTGKSTTGGATSGGDVV